MNLEKYIASLLYTHDCVVVPDFGGFIGQKLNSVHQKETSVFNPPSKQIIFNPSLTKNDGLLVQEIAQTKGISFDKAKEEVEAGVNFWKKHLEFNSQLVIPGLGIFVKDENGLFSFNPNHDNFLLESFGLESVRARYMLQPQQKTASSTVWWKTAALIPILAGGFLYFSKPQPVADFVNEQWSGFVVPVFNPEIKATPAIESQTMVIVDKLESPVIEESADKIHKYQVIAGSLGTIKEANEEVEKLHRKGFPNAGITHKSERFNFVSFKTFPTKEEAQEYRRNISEEYPDAWVLTVNEE